jgi:hypothetical protein
VAGENVSHVKKIEGTAMRKIIVHEFITLDHILQAPGAPDYGFVEL